MSENGYINRVKTSLNGIRNSHIPLHSSKFLKTKYIHHQLPGMIILKKIGMNNHDFAELMQILTPIKDVPELKRVPHL